MSKSSAMESNIKAITGLQSAADKLVVKEGVKSGTVSRLLYMTYADDKTVTRIASLELRSLHLDGKAA